MPKASLFSSARSQSAAVAGVMGVLLIAAMGAAYAMSGTVRAGLGPGPQSAASRRLNFRGMSLALPGSWEALKGQSSPDHMTQLAVFANARAPQARLLIAKLHPGRRQPVKAVLRGALGQLLQGQSSREVTQPVVVHDRDRTWGQYIGVSETQKKTVLREHMLYVVTRRGEDYWLVYLTSLTDPGEPRKAQVVANLRGFVRIVRSVRFVSDGAKGSP